jgi:hypothetical protein
VLYPYKNISKAVITSFVSVTTVFACNLSSYIFGAFAGLSRYIFMQHSSDANSKPKSMLLEAEIFCE